MDFYRYDVVCISPLILLQYYTNFDKYEFFITNFLQKSNAFLNVQRTPGIVFKHFFVMLIIFAALKNEDVTKEKENRRCLKIRRAGQ